MLVPRTNLADVNLAQPGLKRLEHLIRFNHRRVHLPGVTDVEAEGRFGEPFEYVGKLASGPTDSFAQIHVFDAELSSQKPPIGIPMQSIRMNYEWPSPATLLVELLKNRCL